MKRDELAKYALIASAFLLAGLLTVQAARFADTTAQAEMVVYNRDITLLTATYRGGSDVLYVLHNSNGLLLAYAYDSSRRILKMLDGGRLELGTAFERAAAAAAGGGANRPGQRRAR